MSSEFSGSTDWLQHRRDPDALSQLIPAQVFN